MSRFAHEGMTKIVWSGSIANKAAPTTTELNAATDLTGFVTKDGLQTPANQNMVDSATIAETFDAQGVGSFGGSLNLTMFRDNVSDTAWNLFVYATTGFIVVRRGILIATAWTIGQKVEVYPAQMHEPVPAQSAANEQVKFSETVAVTGQPNLKATVA